MEDWITIKQVKFEVQLSLTEKKDTIIKQDKFAKGVSINNLI